MPKPTLRIVVITLVGALIALGHSQDAGQLVLDVDALQASMDGTTLHATEVPGAHVGAIDDDRFLAIVADEDGTRTVRGYVCDREAGVWLTGEVNGDVATLTSDDGVVRIEATLGEGDVFGVAHLGETDARPFTAAPARGDAGLYRAEAQIDGEDRIAGWVVLEDGRQRGSLDGKGNDILLPPATALN